MRHDGITRIQLTVRAFRRIFLPINRYTRCSGGKSGCRCNAARVWALLRHAHVRFTRRLPDRPESFRVELHGFLSYLIRCNLTSKEYKVFGYKGKQVRDNIHSQDVARFMWAFASNLWRGEVYNLGGGLENSCSILEAFALAEEISGRAQVWTYIESNRIGDHMGYYSDLSKMKTHFPDWRSPRY